MSEQAGLSQGSAELGMAADRGEGTGICWAFPVARLVLDVTNCTQCERGRPQGESLAAQPGPRG